MKKILIIGENSYLATGLNFEENLVDRIRHPFTKANEHKYNEYDFVINFCIQPEHFSRLLSEKEMLDVQVAKAITNKNTKFVFLSSRKVYGSNTVLQEYKETDELKPFDFYSKNKVNIENKLKNIMGKNLLILRTSNIVGLPPKKNSPTFMSWLESELKQNQKVIVTADKNAIKDFISKDYFQYVLKEAVKQNLSGIYNVGAGFGITIKELLENLVCENKLLFDQQEKVGEQFVLNCDKLCNNEIAYFNKAELIKTCCTIRNYMEQK